MANQDKDRVPGEMLAHPSTAGIPEMGAGPGVLAVRLWSAPGKRLDCRTSKSTSPLPGLVRDLVRASGGVTGADNAEVISASFPDVVTALQCARRIQWGVEGLTEYETFRGAAAAILVDAGDAAQRQGAPSAQDWEAAEPGSILGKILLRGSAFEALEGVPGVALSQASAAGCREWAWRSGPANASFTADEQALLGMLRTAGRSDPAVTAPAVADDAAAATRVFSASAPPATRPSGISGADAERPAAAKSLRMPIVVGAVAVLLIAVAVVFFLTRRSPVQSATPSTAPSGQETHPAQNVTPSAQTPPTVQNPPGHASALNPPSKHMKLSDVLKKLTPGDQKATPPPPALHCDLTEEDIQRSLARADRYMHDGDLAEARAAYQHVVGCPSAHERAQEGLIRIQRMAAQNGSPNM
jgi:hypothetical protein